MGGHGYHDVNIALSDLLIRKLFVGDLPIPVPALLQPASYGD